MKGFREKVGKLPVHEASVPVAGDLVAVAAARASIETVMRELSVSMGKIQEELLQAGEILADAFGLSESGYGDASCSSPSLKAAVPPQTSDPHDLAATAPDRLASLRQKERPGDEVRRRASRCTADLNPVDLAVEDPQDSVPGWEAVAPSEMRRQSIFAATTLDSLQASKQKDHLGDDVRREGSRCSPELKPVNPAGEEAKDCLPGRKAMELPETYDPPTSVATGLDSSQHSFTQKDHLGDESHCLVGETGQRSLYSQPMYHVESYDHSAPTKIMVSTGTCSEHRVDAETLPETWPASLGMRWKEGVGRRRPNGSGKKLWFSRRRNRINEPSTLDLQQLSPGPGKRLLVIHPSSNTRVTYDLGCAVILALDFVIIPWMVAWDVTLEGGLYYMAWLSATFWTLDIGMSFITGYTTRDECVLDPSTIWWHYLRSWFFPDAAIVVCDWVSLAVEGSADWRMMRLAKVGRLLRLSALLRMLKLARTISDFMDDRLSEFAQLTIRLGKMICTTLAYTHIMCCIWFFIGRSAPTDTGVRWIDARSLVDESMWYQYATSFHWAMAQITLGATEVSSNTLIERSYSVLCLLLGLLFGSTLVSSLSAMMLEAQMDKRGTHQKMLLLRRYLRENKVERKLASLVEKQLAERLVEREKVKEEQVTGLALLSSSLRSQLRFYLCTPYLQRHPLFKLWVSIDKTFMEHFCRMCMDFVHLRAQDDLFAAGKLAECAYFFISGSVAYTQEPHSSPVKATTVQDVEAGRWVAEAALWSHWVHVGTVHAKHFSEFACVHVANVMEVLRRTTTIIELTSDYCHEFHRRLQASKPPLLEWPDDLQVPLTEWNDVVPAMDRASQVIIGLESIRHVAVNSVWLKATSSLGRLTQEVKDGKSVVMLNSEGGLERVVSAVALKIHNDQEEFLVQIGKEDGGGMVPACQLPGSKQGVGESPADTMERVLRGKLAYIDTHLDITHLTRSIEWKDWRERGVCTKYLRYVVHSKLGGGVDLERVKLPEVSQESVREAMRADKESPQIKYQATPANTSDLMLETVESVQRQLSGLTNCTDCTLDLNGPWALSNRPVFCMQDSDGVNRFFAWFNEEDFAQVRGPIGEKLLPKWLAFLEKPALNETSDGSEDVVV